MEPTAQNNPSVNDSHMTMRYAQKRWWLAFPIVIVGLFLWMWITSPMIVIVDGYGEVEVSATRAVLTYSMVGQGADPASAIAAVNAKVSTAETVLIGVAPNDISKSQIQVVPATGGGGFQAVISVGVKTASVSGAQNLISTLYSAGATVVSQPVLSVDEPKEFEKQAFDLALADAKKKAGQIGNNNFKFIRKIIGITESASSSTSTATKGPNIDTEIENPETLNSGVFKVSKAVTVSYKMW